MPICQIFRLVRNQLENCHRGKLEIGITEYFCELDRVFDLAAIVFGLESLKNSLE